ncbi:MAG TPA: hypothetical protein VJU84_21495 [Pyrinomonadaceae bacterium]|nr:hypothetical protein [Pyrinomonadaceae bacterium]
MKIILDISTILGGIAAIWFFWDRIATYRNGAKLRSFVKMKRPRSAVISKNGRNQWRMWGGTFGALFGGLGWFAAEHLNLYSFPITFFISVAAIALSTPKSLGRSINPEVGDQVIAAIGLGIASSLYTSIVGIIVYTIMGSIGGVLAITLGAILGAVYGCFSLNIETPYMVKA